MPFLVPPKVIDVDAGVDGHRTQRIDGAAVGGDGVGDPGAVHVHPHAVPVGGVADRGDVGGGVHGAELGALRDRHDRRLGVMRDAQRVHFVLDLLGCEPAVGGREVDQLGADHPLGGARLVDVDVRPVGADRRHRRGGRAR